MLHIHVSSAKGTKNAFVWEGFRLVLGTTGTITHRGPRRHSHLHSTHTHWHELKRNDVIYTFQKRRLVIKTKYRECENVVEMLGIGTLILLGLIFELVLPIFFSSILSPSALDPQNSFSPLSFLVYYSITQATRSLALHTTIATPHFAGCGYFSSKNIILE